MRTIHKFQLAVIHGPQPILMPAHARICATGLQGGSICIWADVLTDSAIKTRIFHVIGTGHPMPDSGIGVQYIGTVQMGAFVWHVVEENNLG